MAAQRTPTPARILAVALDLFNRRGSLPVTTHDIAKACGISPGNLYYHYRNKEEIIRALFDDALAMHRRHEAEQRRAAAPEQFGDGVAFLKEFNWRYRFFKRELPTLLQRDCRLQAAFRAFQALHLRRLERAVRQAARRGELRPLDFAERRMLVELSWLVALFWPSFVEVGGGPLNRRNVDRGADLLQTLFACVAAAPVGDVRSRGKAAKTR